MTKTRMDSTTFLTNLRKSGLIPEPDLTAALERVPATDRARSVARALVQVGLLTKFQAELLLIGRTNGFTLGQYRILDQLGQGGMGRVFKAEHMAMGRTVAIKVLAPQHTRTPKARELFMREVRASGRLMHPNIVTAHDANEIGGRHYLVMEYIDGPNLDQLVRERGPLPVGLACDLVRQTALGLQHAFEKGMVHRDIKPSNVLLQRSGSPLSPGWLVKVLDFGLARLGDKVEKNDGTILAAANSIMGTPDYLSPEQVRNLHLVDIRSDLYSLGCTFYYLLAGQVPFPGGTTTDKLIRQTKEQPVPVEQLRPDIPEQVADMVRCLMAKEPAHRFQTPAELVAELAPFAAPMAPSWSANRSAVSPSSDTVCAPGNTGGSSLALEDRALLGSTDRHSALAPLPQDLLPGPLWSEGDVQLLPPSIARRRAWWVQMGLFTAAGMVAGALGCWLLLRW
jgi:serine/threonine-protein kinase